VDACYAERVLKYLPDPAGGVAEMARVLRPGGRVACFELDQHATVLTGDPQSSGLVDELLCAPLGETRMGRRLPAAAASGLPTVTWVGSLADGRRGGKNQSSAAVADGYTPHRR
jgi:SAM-dependent methyltransferase